MANESIKDLFARYGNVVHRAIMKGTGGRIGGTGFGMPVVILTTTGRKSGKQRTTMLTTPVHDENRVVLVASYGGDDRHPAWFLNLRENPDVELEMRGKKHSMRARVASAEEKESCGLSTSKYNGTRSIRPRPSATSHWLSSSPRERLGLSPRWPRRTRTASYRPRAPAPACTATTRRSRPDDRKRVGPRVIVRGAPSTTTTTTPPRPPDLQSVFSSWKPRCSQRRGRRSLTGSRATH